MEHLLISVDKILKSIQNVCSEDLIFDNLFSCFNSIFDTEIVFVDFHGNVFKKSKCDKINSLRFDFKKIILNGFDDGLNKISELKYSEYFVPQYLGFVSPILLVNRYLGLLFVYSKENLSDECIVCLKSISMFISAVVFEDEKDFERKRSENKEIVKSAFGTLSYSEFEAILGIFSELKGTEGILIMKKIAENLNITRSVIVNAIKKIESANIIESRSLGMKGTYIKVLNKSFIEEIEKIKK